MLLKDASKLALKYSLSIKERPVTIDYYSDAYEYFISNNGTTLEFDDWLMIVDCYAREYLNTVLSEAYMQIYNEAYSEEDNNGNQINN